MRLFHSIFDYQNFMVKVTGETRFRFDKHVERFLKTVEQTGIRRIVDLPAGATFYRAQVGQRTKHFTDSPMVLHYPFAPARMIPEPRSATEGRVNPKGIPCLYLADHPQVAMSEVRPWIGAYVSLGAFVTLRSLKLMDCTAPRIPSPLRDVTKHNRPEFEERVWGDISRAFSEPVTESDRKAAYAPTQVLAEVFKGMGCDGIKYKSLLGENGNSFALFNLRDAKLTTCSVLTTKTITHEFSETNEPSYCVTETGEEVFHGGPTDDEPEEDGEATGDEMFWGLPSMTDD